MGVERTADQTKACALKALQPPALANWYKRCKNNEGPPASNGNSLDVEGSDFGAMFLEYFTVHENTFPADLPRLRDGFMCSR